MWEKTREDGSRRLRCDAVPTKFFFTKEVSKRKSPTERKIKSPLKKNDSEENSLKLQNQSTSNNINIINSDQSNQCKINYESMFKKMIEYERHYKTSNAKVNSLKNWLQFMTKKLKNLENNTLNLNFIFNTDQIQALNRRSTKFMKWSNSTITKALKLKFSCGNNGYEELIKQKIPLPSLRTLRRRLQNLKFEPGILDEVFKFLEVKIQTFKSDHEKDCVLIMDEMAITPANLFDVSSNKNIGKINLPNHEGTGTSVLVFMLGGISTRWKQTVAYFFTGKSVNGDVYHDIVIDIISKTESLGLNVIALISDMGSSNRGLWKKWNITAGRHCKVSNFLSHPLDANRKLFVIPDVPHIFKNIKNMLMSNKLLFISNKILQFYNLPTNIICSSHIEDVIKYQEKLDFVLVPKLSELDLMPNHYQKMKVGKSTNVINHDVYTALQFLSEELHKPEYLTTAWFINIIDKWFSLMTSRHPILALSKLKPDIYENTIQFLNSFIDVMKGLEVGNKRTWKPSQTGSILATTSILDIQKIYLFDKGFKFLLTSRFTQDCLENLFSVLRTKNVVPNALQIKNYLKLLSVSQYLREVSTGSYEEDDRTFLSGFLDTLNTEPSEPPPYQLINIQLPPEVSEHDMNLCNGELNSLYNVCGYLISSIKKRNKVCSDCLSSVGSKNSINASFSKLSKLKRYKKGCLFFCNEITFNYFLVMENIFRKYYCVIKNENCNIKSFLIEQMKKIEIQHIPDCHNLKNIIMSRFVVFRLKIAGKKNNKLINKYGSKSIACHT